MSDLHVVATIPAKPGSEDAVRGVLQTLVAATLEEDGCVGYQLYESGAAPGTFVTIEQWRDQAALDVHLGGPAVAAAFGAAGDHLAGEVAVHPLAAVD
jgi:quinol monooxygenase YgiN